MSISPLNSLAEPHHYPLAATETDIVNARLSQVFNILEHEHTQRAEIEGFIREKFAATHGAHIAKFMPRLFSLRSKHNELIAAFGLRAAARDRLFLETYLAQPIEEVLQDRLGIQVRREEIIEVGNMSALYPGAARWLIVAVTALLYSEGYKWVVFTGAPTLRNGFHRLGLRPLELGPASLDALPQNERSDWGSYYDHAPVVMSGDIEHGYRSLLMQNNLVELLRAGIDNVKKGDPA